MVADNSVIVVQNDNLDIKAMPEFVHITKGQTPMSGLVFSIIVENAERVG